MLCILQKCDGHVKIPSVNSALGDAVTLGCFIVQFAVLPHNINLQSSLKKTHPGSGWHLLWKVHTKIHNGQEATALLFKTKDKGDFLAADDGGMMA